MLYTFSRLGDIRSLLEEWYDHEEAVWAAVQVLQLGDIFFVVGKHFDGKPLHRLYFISRLWMKLCIQRHP